MAYDCTTADQCGNPVVILFTRLTDGGTEASCDDHMPIALVGMLSGWLDIDAQRLYDTIQRFADRETKAAVKAAEKAAEHAGNGTPAATGDSAATALSGVRCTDCGAATLDGQPHKPDCPSEGGQLQRELAQKAADADAGQVTA